MNNLIKLLDNGQHGLFLQQVLPALQALKDNEKAQLISNVFALNKKYDLTSKPEFAPFINGVSERVVLPMLAANQFNFEFVKLAAMLTRSGVKIENDAPYKTIVKTFEKYMDDAHKKKDLKIYYFTLMAIYVIKVFRGQSKSAKEFLIKKLFDLNTDETLASVHFKIVGDNFVSIFPDYREIFDIAEKNVFTAKYWGKDLLAQKANIYWITAIMWNIYGQEKGFVRMYDTFRQLFLESVKRKKLEYAFFVHFPASHIFMNLADDESDYVKFNEEMEKPFAEFVQKLAQEEGIEPVLKTESKPDGKVRVGFVYDRIVGNSPFKYLHSLLAFLQQYGNGKYEYYVYDIECIEKSKSDPSCVEMIKKLGITYYTAHDHSQLKNEGLYYSHKEKSERLRAQIIADGIDIMVSSNNREQFNYLLGTRTAPVQIYWCHGNFAYDVHGIDHRTCHWKEESHPEYALNFVGLLNMYLAPAVDKSKLIPVRSRWSKDTVILGSIGRLVKVNSPEYLRVVCDIMKECENTVYLVCGVGGYEEILEYINGEGLRDRFFFEGMVDPHLYGNVIDIFLGTFPYSSGTASREFRAKGRPVIGLNDYSKANRSMEDFLDCPLNAVDTKELYKEIAIKLIREPAVYEQVCARLDTLIKEESEWHARETVVQWEAYFAQAYTAAGLTDEG
jgi:hypothetical protein